MMMGRSSTSIALPLGQVSRVISGCVFAACLGLMIPNPFKPVVENNAQCLGEQVPSTLIVNTQTQASPSCLVVMAATE